MTVPEGRNTGSPAPPGDPVPPGRPSDSRGSGAAPGRTARQWLDGFAAELGLEPPADDEVATLLRVASVAAHGSERTAAPLTCWLAARAGASPDEALAAARRLAGVAEAGER